MQTISREEAIEKMGISRSYLGHFPRIKHSIFASIRHFVEAVLEDSDETQVIAIKEHLGDYDDIDAVIDENNKLWHEDLNNVFEDVKKPTEEYVQERMICVARESYEAARGVYDQRKRITSVEVFNKMVLFVIGEDVKLPDSNDLYKHLLVKFDRLPDVIQVPNRLLNRGDKVYQVYDENSDVKILEFKVEKIRAARASKRVEKPGTSCSSDFEDVRQNDVYDVQYVAMNKESTQTIHFELNDKGDFKGVTTGDGQFSRGSFHLTLEDAQKAEAEIWAAVADKLNSYWQRVSAPKPA